MANPEPNCPSDPEVPANEFCIYELMARTQFPIPGRLQSRPRAPGSCLPAWTETRPRSVLVNVRGIGYGEAAWAALLRLPRGPEVNQRFKYESRTEDSSMRAMGLRPRQGEHLVMCDLILTCSSDTRQSGEVRSHDHESHRSTSDLPERRVRWSIEFDSI